MSGKHDTATLHFTYMKVEDEIRRVWDMIRSVRSDDKLPDPIRDLELARLFEVQNTLVVESLRQQEVYMKNFLRSLNLNELGVRPITEGNLKTHLMQQMPKKNPNKPRATSFGFFDSYSDNPEQRANQMFAGSQMHASDIIVNRRRELRQEIRRLSFRESLTLDERKRKDELAKQLRKISEP